MVWRTKYMAKGCGSKRAVSGGQVKNNIKLYSMDGSVADLRYKNYQAHKKRKAAPIVIDVLKPTMEESDQLEGAGETKKPRKNVDRQKILAELSKMMEGKK